MEKILFLKGNNLLLNFFIIISSIIIFRYIYGLKIINPQNTNWIYELKGDLAQHHIGWESFRKSNLSIPLGSNLLTYPFKNSIIYTDSIPIFALIFKILNPFLSKNFQYIGIWGLLSFILQGIFSGMVINLFIKDKLLVYICSISCLISPSFFQRMYAHSALSAHWMIFFGLYIFYNDNYSFKRVLILSSIISFICSMTHACLLGINCIIIISFCLKHFLLGRNIIELIIILINYIITALLTIHFILAGFTNKFSEMSSIRLGEYSLNLNSFINPLGYSTFLKSLKVKPAQNFESFAYLGLGFIILFIISSILLYKNESKENIKKNYQYVIPICFLLIVAYIFALSPTITCFNKKILRYPVPKFIKKFWGIFRSTGRFGWICVYNFYILSFVIINKYIQNKKIVYLIFIFGLIIQCLDQSIVFKRLNEKYNKYYENPPKLSAIKEWNIIFNNNEIKHFYFCSYLYRSKCFDFARMALKYNKTLNRFYISHFRTEDFNEQCYKDVNNPNNNSIYFYDINEQEKLPVLNQTKLNFNYYTLNNWILLYKGKLNFLKEFFPNKIEDLNKNIILDKNNIYKIPNFRIHFGDYELYIDGKNLHDISINLYSNKTKINYNYGDIRKENWVNIFFKVDINTYDFEIILSNNSNSKMIINSIKIQLIDFYFKNCMCLNFKGADEYYSNICLSKIFG